MSIFNWLTEKPVSAPLKKGEYQKSLVEILKKIEDSSKKGNNDRTAWLYQMASVLARRANEFSDSAKYALLAADYSVKDGKQFNAGWSYRSAAIAYKEKGEYKDAVRYALLGAKSFKQSKSSYAAQWCYNLAGQASKEAGDLDSAIKYYEHSYAIEPNEETEKDLISLKHMVSHPTVDQYAEKSEVFENEPVLFEVVVENHGKETINDIIVGDKDARLMHEIDILKPGDVKMFSYETKGKTGWLHSPYNFITWKNEHGDSFDMELEPAAVLVKPRIQINSYLNPSPLINKTSELVILVKNMSSSPLYDVKLDVDFSSQVDAKQLSPNMFSEIAPGEESGTDWKIRPTIPGGHKIASGNVIMLDENGTRFEQSIPDVVAEVLEKGMKARKPFEEHEEFRQEKKRFGDSITAYPMTEGHYVTDTKKMWHQQRGFTFRGVGLDVVTRHVEENCKDMTLVSSHGFDKEHMRLYSFKLDGIHYLLTVVIKLDEGFMHLIFKLYSENKETLVPTLKRIADIIRYTISNETEAREVEHVEIKKIINIVDSIVQRSAIGAGGEEGKVTEKKTKISDSVVQRTDV